MESNLENFLKNKMSVDEIGIANPDLSLIENAGKKIGLRRKISEKKPSVFGVLSAFFHPKLKLYYTGFASLIIIFGIFYILKQKSKSNNFNMSGYSNTKTSVNSSTVLASLTQYTLNNTSVKSSTVLSSIMTFVVRN